MDTTNETKLTIYLPDLATGGVPNLYLSIADQLLDAGFYITFLLDRRRGELLAKVPDRARVVELGASRQLFAPLKLHAYLKREKPDILLTAIEQMHISTIIACRLSGSDARHVVTLHNPLSSQARRPGLAFKALPLLYRLLIRQAHAIVGVSYGVADDMASRARIPRDRIEVIYNGVVDAKFKLRRDSGEVAVVLPAGVIAPLIVNAGRMSEQKDHETLIRAFACLGSKPQPYLAILGDGPLRPSLEALATELGVTDRILTPGIIANPLPTFKAADLFVLSSRYEGLPLVLVETLACGTPVVSTDCPYGPREILNGGEFGTLVPIGNPAALAKAIDDSLGRTHERQRLIIRSEQFSIEQCAKEYAELFRRLLAAAEKAKLADSA